MRGITNREGGQHIVSWLFGRTLLFFHYRRRKKKLRDAVVRVPPQEVNAALQEMAALNPYVKEEMG